jgi:5'-nucleotidase/UDP-sugar diphosphatase
MSINEYNASGGDSYPKITQMAGFVSTDETDSQALKRFFAEHSPVDASEFIPK